MTRVSMQYGAVNLSQGFPDFEPPKEILDRMAQDREASYVQRINQLELDRALCGIPRTSPYGYGIYANYPRAGGGCCGNGGYGYGYVA